MKVYILIENTVAYLGTTSLWIRRDHCRSFASMQSAINAMRLWKPTTFESPYKINNDVEHRSRIRNVLYQYINDDDNENSYISMSTELEIKTAELE
jgi:hypothetical protein